MLDTLSRNHYRNKCENQFLKFKRTEFQSWFANIMGKAYPGDYQRIRQSQGDRGCDGYRITTQTIYQVYAPREIRPGELNRKIMGDFEQAKNEFVGKMKEWIFVHNDPDGLTPETAVDTLGHLSTSNPGIKISTHSFNEIWDIIEGLGENDILDLLGSAPTMADLNCLQINSIVPVLKFIERREVPSDVPVDAPDPQKLEFNNFRIEVQDLLKSGRRKEKLVQDYLENVRDPSYGESLAESFRGKYNSLKSGNLHANEIFDELRKFTGGDQFHDSFEQAATLAVLSYFFERCDIFENPA